MATHVADRNQECTVWVGGLEPPVTDELLYELMLQAGPVVNLNMPRDAVTSQHQAWQTSHSNFKRCVCSTCFVVFVYMHVCVVYSPLVEMLIYLRVAGRVMHSASFALRLTRTIVSKS
jgi:hypothetical protein